MFERFLKGNAEQLHSRRCSVFMSTLIVFESMVVP